MEDRLEMRIAVGNHKTAGGQHMRRLAGRRVRRIQSPVRLGSRTLFYIQGGGKPIDTMDGHDWQINVALAAHFGLVA